MSLRAETTGMLERPLAPVGHWAPVSPVAHRLWTPEAVITVCPNVQTYGKINMPQYYNECTGCERIQPDLLDAFRSNPLTHSLTSAV